MAQVLSSEPNRLESKETLEGPRLHVCVLGLTLALFFSVLETTIVSTTLGTIAAHFHDRLQFSWIVTAYLVTFNGFLLLHARLSDVFGRFTIFNGCLAMFGLFSGLCGAAQSMVQLIVFRALQGVGASGIFSLTMVIVPDITPDRWLGLYSGVISSVFALASILGPVLGGALAEYSSWRWVFLLNVPGAAVCAVLLASSSPRKRTGGTCGGLKFPVGKWKQIDIPGAVLLLAATVLFIYALQSVPSSGSGQGWSSPVIIGSLVASGVSFISFILYERFLPRYSSIPPFFPLSLLLERNIALLMISSFFMGSSFYFTIIQLPQRLQQVNAKSPTTAGILVLPVLLPSAAFSALSGGLYRKFPTATPLLLFLGGCFQALGVGLLSSLPTGLSVASKQYGFEVIAGVGFGLMLPSFLILARDWTSEELYATAMGLVNTFRTLGGCVSIAIGDAIMNQELDDRLEFMIEEYSTPSATVGLMDNNEEASTVRAAYGEVYNRQFFVMAMLAIVSAVAAGVIWVMQYRRKEVLSV